MNDADRKRVDEVLAYAKEQGIGMKFHKIYLERLLERISAICEKFFFSSSRDLIKNLSSRTKCFLVLIKTSVYRGMA